MSCLYNTCLYDFSFYFSLENILASVKSNETKVTQEYTDFILKQIKDEEKILENYRFHCINEGKYCAKQIQFLKTIIEFKF